MDAFGCKRQAWDVSCGVGVAHEVAEKAPKESRRGPGGSVVEARSGIFHAQNPRREEVHNWCG